MTEEQKSPPKSARRRARELALQGVYQWLVNRDDAGAIEAHIRDTQEFDKVDGAHFNTVFHGVIREAERLRERFASCLDRQVSELSPVEHGVLLIGAYELTHLLEVPYRVVINEAVELAKSFGGTEGYKYVNGVLDKLAVKVRDVEVNAGRR